MKGLRRIWARLKGTFPSERREAELAAELENHLQLQTDDHIRRGMSPEEARRQAVLKLGGLESIKETYRDQRRIPALGDFLRDVRFALRNLRRSPAFASSAVLSLALGIAVTCAVFSLINAIVYGSMPYRDPERLVILMQSVKAKNGVSLRDPSVADIVDYSKASKTLDAIGYSALFVDSATFIAEGPAESVFAQAVSPNLSSVLGVRPVLGRAFFPDEERAVLLSHDFWKRRFDANPAVLGKRVVLGDTAVAIVGVLPPHFRIVSDTRVDVFSCENSKGITTRKEHWYTPIARLAPGVTPERVRA